MRLKAVKFVFTFSINCNFKVEKKKVISENAI